MKPDIWKSLGFFPALFTVAPIVLVILSTLYAAFDNPVRWVYFWFENPELLGYGIPMVLIAACVSILLFDRSKTAGVENPYRTEEINDITE